MYPRTSLVVSLVLAIVARTVSGNIAEDILYRRIRDASSEVKLCPPLSSPSAIATCTLRDVNVACDSNVQPGTIAKAKCKHFFEPMHLELTCLENGEWDQPSFECTSECGSSKLERNTDGTEVGAGAFPWHAGLYYRQKKNGVTTWEQKCSGTLITNQFVLTVAHCVVDTAESNIRVALGKHYQDWHKTEQGESKHSVSTIIYNPDFNKKMNSFDIALLRLNEKVVFGETIKPVCHGLTLEPKYQLDNLYVYGWGKEVDSTNTSNNTLVYDTVTVVDQDVCRKNSDSVYPIFDKFCTTKGNKSEMPVVQRADNGGGITAVFDGHHFLLGAFSGADSQHYEFTNLSWPLHVIWIESQMRKYDPIFGWGKNEITEVEATDSGCVLPEASPSTKFCPLKDGCKNCDTHDPLCSVPVGSKVDGIRVVCAPGYTLRNPYEGGDVATCRNGQWYPGLPECHKYRYIPGNPWGKVKWQEAKHSCEDKGYQLATIKNEGEEKVFKETVLNFFKSTGIKPGNVWLGLNDLTKESTFEWVDGSILSKSDFAPWALNEPSDSDFLEHCVQANSGCGRVEDCFHWNDNYCSELNNYFCKEIVPSDAPFDQSADFGENIPKAKPRYKYLPGDPWSKVTWHEARDNCFAKGSQLAIMRDADQLRLFEEALTKQFKDTGTAPSSTWIGLISAKVEGKRLFNWVDGSIYNAWRPGNWNNWITKRSNWNWDCTEAAAGDTLKLWPHARIYQWNDVNCTNVNHYFCSVKL